MTGTRWQYPVSEASSEKSVDTLTDGIERISFASFEQDAAVLARLSIRYIDMGNGNEVYKQLGVHSPRTNTVNHSLAAEGVPDGTLITFIANVSAIGDTHLGKWFVVDRKCDRKVHLKLSGIAFYLWFELKSVDTV